MTFEAQARETRSRTHRSGSALPRAVALLAASLLARGAAAATEGPTLALPGPGAAAYGPDPALACKGTGVAKALETDFAELAHKSGKPEAVMDGRLCVAAEALVAWNRPEAPEESALTALSWHLGLPTPIQRRGVFTATLEGQDWRDIAERFADAASSYLGTLWQPRFGVAVKELREGGARGGVVKSVVALVLADLPVDLEPVPRKLAAGASAALSGKIPEGLSGPKVYVCGPTGKLEAPAEPGPGVTADLRCPERPGILLADVRASKGGELLTLARLAILCGGAPEVAPAAQPRRGPVEAGAAEKALFDQANALRASAGLSPLALDPAVAGVARRAAEAYRARSQGAAEPFDVAARLKEVEVPTLLVLQNPVAALSVEEAAAATAQSPINRCNILNPDTNAGAAGVAVTTDAKGNTLVFATELFVRELVPVDPEAVRAKLRGAIAERRDGARAPALAQDPVLDEVAEKYAQLLASHRGSPPKADESAVVAPLYASYSKVDVMSGVKAEPLDFAQEPGMIGPAQRLGVGVALGTNAVLGKNAAYVVVVLGTPHEAKKGTGE